MRRGLVRSLVVSSLAFAVAACGRREPELPVLATIPEFTLVDQTGAERHARDFRGEPFVAAFLFTRCTSVCPMLTAQMTNFQRRLRGAARDVRFVAFSVDPAHDTPAVLAAYARERGATDHFTFLTGDGTTVQEVARRGFLVGVGEPTPTEGGGVDVLHSQHLLLVDRSLRLRGFYRTDAAGLDQLEHDLGRLLAAN